MKKALNKKYLEKLYNSRSYKYDNYHSFVTFHSDQIGREILVSKAVKDGDAVLDAGGGTGSTALLAAQKIGNKGKVTVLDLSQGMLDIARKRAGEMKLDHRMEFIKGDIDQLPFSHNSFDTVLSTYSACPLGDPAAGAFELLRVAKQDGLLGMAHSVAPRGFAKILGKCIEEIAWKFPFISLGCRSVEVLPALLRSGTELIFDKRIGLPFLPFEVFVVRKTQSNN